MSDEQLTKLLGRSVENGRCDGARVYNHRWDMADTFVDDWEQFLRAKWKRFPAGCCPKPFP